MIPINLETIISAVSKEFGVPRDLILSSSRARAVSAPRHVLFYLARELLDDCSFSEIAEAITSAGGYYFHRSTILKAHADIMYYLNNPDDSSFSLAEIDVGMRARALKIKLRKAK